jgi:hypothetical protein
MQVQGQAIAQARLPASRKNLLPTNNIRKKGYAKKAIYIDLKELYIYIKIFCRFATLRHGHTSVPDGLSR